MKYLIYIALAGLVLLTLGGLFNSSFFQLHDFTHIARLVEMDLAIQDGHFPVRWARDFAYGYGMPLFSFYGPLPAYIAEGFHLLGFSFLVSLKLFLILASCIGAWGMYELSRRYFGRAGGMISAAVFTFMPYRALDLYVRGALNELFGLYLIPWIMLALLRLRAAANAKWASLTAVSFLALFLTHNLMTMMFVPVLYAFALTLLIGLKRKRRYLMWLHVSLVLSVLAASFFLLPSYLEKGFTQVEALIGGYSYYKYHFLYIRQLFTGVWAYGGSILGPEDDISFSFGWVVWGLAALGSVVWFFTKKRIENKLVPAMFVAVTGIAFFMTLFKSSFIWDAVPLLAYFQFPWRFLAIPAICMSVLAGGVVLAFNKRKMRAIAVVMVSVVLAIANMQYFQPKAILDTPDALYYEDRNRIQAEMSGILPDYIPTDMRERQAPFQAPFELAQSDVEISTLVDRTQERLVSFTLDKSDTLTIRIAWFPDWTVYDKTEKIPYTVDEKTGFMHVELGEGEHLIGVRFEDTPLRTASNLISLVGLVGIVGVYMYGRHRRD